jgi:chemotaxis protein histidine kinase CheA
MELSMNALGQLGSAWAVGGPLLAFALGAFWSQRRSEAKGQRTASERRAETEVTEPHSTPIEEVASTLTSPGLPSENGPEALIGPAETPKRDVREVVLEAISRDRSGFVGFVREVRLRLDEISSGELGVGTDLALVTLSATAAMLGLDGLAAAAEAALGHPPGKPPAPEALDALRGEFETIESLLARAHALDAEESVEVPYPEFEALLDLAQSSEDSRELVEKLSRLRQEPTRRNFRKLRGYAELVAAQRGLPKPEVTISDDGVHLSRERFSGLWASLLLLVDNAFAHGLEPAEERRALGKPEALRLTFRSRVEGQHIWIEVADDGRGVDWSIVAEKARQARLRGATRDDLVQALKSGRIGERNGGQCGLGLRSVLSTCQELHGDLSIISTLGRGTTLRITLPLRSNLAVFVPSLNPRHAEVAGIAPRIVGREQAAS